jgi:hypothetical protein
MSEATQSTGAAATTDSDPLSGLSGRLSPHSLAIHTIESWARAVIEDLVKELEHKPPATAVDTSAKIFCKQLDDGSFGVSIQVQGLETHSMHRVKVGAGL